MKNSSIMVLKRLTISSFLHFRKNLTTLWYVRCFSLCFHRILSPKFRGEIRLFPREWIDFPRLCKKIVAPSTFLLFLCTRSLLQRSENWFVFQFNFLTCQFFMYFSSSAIEFARFRSFLHPFSFTVLLICQLESFLFCCPTNKHAFLLIHLLGTQDERQQDG